MITEAEERAYKRVATKCEKARAEAGMFRGPADDESGRRLALARAEAEIELHDAWLALDAADEAVAELDDLARRAARAFSDSQAPASVPPLESYAAKAVTAHAAALAASMSKAADRERNEQEWISTWSAIRSACALYDSERQAHGLPPARWYIPANPHDFRELLGPRPAPPRSSWSNIASDLKREMRPADFTDRVTRGSAPGDLADARARRAG